MPSFKTAFDRIYACLFLIFISTYVLKWFFKLYFKLYFLYVLQYLSYFYFRFCLFKKFDINSSILCPWSSVTCELPPTLEVDKLWLSCCFYRFFYRFMVETSRVVWRLLCRCRLAILVIVNLVQSLDYMIQHRVNCTKAGEKNVRIQRQFHQFYESL